MPPMTLRDTLAANLIRFEGSIAWPYLDTRGNVTVGVGAMIADEAHFTALAFVHGTPPTAATAAQKSAAWRALKAAAFGPTVAAQSFSRTTDLRLTDASVRTLLDGHIEAVHRELAYFYKASAGFSADFDAMPQSLQLALYDMAFSLGVPKLTGVFRQFNDALKHRDWALAATQSHRNGIPESRNAYVHDLLAALH